ncbi:MAG: polysaccharide deacetylase family protein [Candidatus Paraimprobicoccus trichonymphae]|uniref:Polysaccharide deacetylase family protein n=1 Tax=Candidatus Paraimprobicoccus trichonymphae TaxID=3033793 RepID=A0AA48KXW2_9FIRM|nr:MAG: polysaccharide deacetylase family protein [Candidatus Paraimprobicoccus trichonymphae]
MRFFIILTKKKLFLILSCFVLTIVSVFINIFAVAKQKIKPIFFVQTDKKLVSLTFDAGWGNEQTPTLLKIFKDNDIKVTFFLVGDWVRKYPDSVEEISQAGHDVQNHSNTHPHLTKLSEEKVVSEIKECNDAIEKIINKRPYLIRAPYGDYDEKVIKTVTEKENMHFVQWDVDTIDWRKDASIEKILDRVKKKSKNGSIILMHNGAECIIEALPKIIAYLKEQKYEIVPLSKLIYKDGEKFSIEHDGKQLQPETAKTNTKITNLCVRNQKKSCDYRCRNQEN